MKQVLTVSCKLNVSAQQLPKIEETLKAFADACEWVNKTLDSKLTNEVAMQSLCYHDVRARFGLSAQLTIHAIRRVSGNRKTAKKDGKREVLRGESSLRSDVSGGSFPGKLAPELRQLRALLQLALLMTLGHSVFGRRTGLVA